MLTKQECEKALNSLYKVADKLVLNHDVFIGSYDILKKLIQIHFSNPPLKYEEIEEGKWYWHNNKKEWVKILNKDVCTSVSPVIETIHEYINFERNCLYRKQVKE